MIGTAITKELNDSKEQNSDVIFQTQLANLSCREKSYLAKKVALHELIRLVGIFLINAFSNTSRAQLYLHFALYFFVSSDDFFQFSEDRNINFFD